jgi:hypothetical protein
MKSYTRFDRELGNVAFIQMTSLAEALLPVCEERRGRFEELSTPRQPLGHDDWSPRYNIASTSAEERLVAILRFQRNRLYAHAAVLLTPMMK